MFHHPYKSFLGDVEKPGRYVGGEFGAVTPKPNPPGRVALAFPDVYEVGTSHIGLSILYQMVNERSGFSAERVYMPWPDMVAKLRSHGVPLCSLESARPLSEFHVVGFSLQYELSFTNVLNMLDLARIPRRTAARCERDPLVVVGGPVAVQAEPISPFVDAVVLGDGEETLLRVLETEALWRKRGTPRADLLAALSQLPNVLVPALLERVWDQRSGRMVPVKKEVASLGVVADLAAYPTGFGPVPMVQAVFDRYSVEIARGCTEGCRFCQAGYLYRPVRERGVEQVATALKVATCCLGFDEVSLSALSSADHSQIEPLLLDLGNRYLDDRVSFSVPSLRAYGLSDPMVSVLSRLRATGVTLAPEAGSQRLRDVINKNITEEDLFGAARRFFSHGFTKIKLYFMLGLPTETDEDLLAMVSLAERLRKLGRSMVGGRATITVSASTFVPKPFTPFEREEMIGPDEVVRRQGLISAAGRAAGLKVKTHDVRLSVLEGLFSRGDEALSEVLERAVDLGAMYDGWDELFNEAIWEQALTGVAQDHYLAAIPWDAGVPWQAVSTGVTQAFRSRERALAQEANTTNPCGLFVDEQSEQFICHQCGLKCKRGALAKRPVRQKPDVAEMPPLPKPRRGRPSPGKVVQAGEQAVRYRLLLSYVGRQVYIGHLDRMRHLMRSLKRAGIELWYTQGFHPKPKIEAPPPLPLGHGALADPFDLYIASGDGDDLLTRLNDSLPPDMKAVAVLPLTGDDPKLSKAFTACHYLVSIGATSTAVKTVLARLETGDPIVVSRQKKGQRTELEIGQYLMDARQIDSDLIDLPGVEPTGRTLLSMTLALHGSGGTRPLEILEAVWPGTLPDTMVFRNRFLNTKEKLWIPC